MRKKNSAFTLIEIMLGILIVTIVIIGGFQALSSVTLGKIKLMEKTDIVKDSFYFSEKFFEEIKKGGTIDYEEYFNRKVIGNVTESGHYSSPTGFGNFGNGGSLGNPTYGNGFYYCRSTTASMGIGGCYNTSTTNGPQRYGQYAFQFIDYNANQNSDGGDENGDGNLRGDDDDENLGEGPTIFTGGTDVREMYLISGDRKKRTLFRWNWHQDIKSPKNGGVYIYPCNSTTFGTGCLGTIEFLRLEGKDWGLSHNSGTTSTGSFDGIIDTWIIDKEFTGGAEVIAGSTSNGYRQPLFPNSMSVTELRVFMYPNTSIKYAWKNLLSSEVNPYAKIQISLSPSWKKRGAMKGKIPKIDFSTTVNLTDYFSN